MKNLLKSIFHKSFHDEFITGVSTSELNEHTSKRRLLFQISWGTIGLATISMILACFVLPDNLWRWIMIICVINFLNLIIQLLNYKGYYCIGSAFFLFFFITIVFNLAWTAGGMKAVAMQYVPIFVLIAGLLLGWKMGLITAILGIIWGLFLTIAEYAGILPISAVTYNPLGLWIMSTTFIGFLALLQYLSVSKLDKALKNAYQELITRTKVEQELRKSETFRKRVFDSSRVPIVVMDANSHKYIDCNQAAVEIYRYSSFNEINGKKPMDFSAPNQYDGTPSEEKAQFYIDKALKEGSVVFEWKHQRPDGEYWDAKVHLMSFSVDNIELLQFTLIDITERKKSEMRFQSLVEMAPVGICIANQGKFVYVNKAYEILTGYKADELLNMNIIDLVAPQMKQEFIERANKRTEGLNVENTYETIGIRKNKMLYNSLVTATIIDYQDSKATIAIHQDITEIKASQSQLKERTEEIEAQNEEYLQLNEELHQANYELRNAKEKAEENEIKFRAVFENSRDAIGVAKFGLHYFANPAYLKLFEFESNESIMGSTVLNHIAPSHRQQVAENIRLRTLGASAPTFYESRGLRTDGTEFDGEWNISTFILNDERLSIASIRDITERKKAEQALKLSERRFKDTTNLLPQIVFETDINGKLIYVNAIAFKLFGYSQEDFNEGLLAVNMIIPEQRQVALKRIGELLTDDKSMNTEYTALKKDGTTFPVVIYSNTIIINNNIAGLRGIIFDITERKRSEKIIKESEGRLQKLLNSVTDYSFSVKIVNGISTTTEHGEGCKTITGYSANEFLQDKYLWYNIIHENDKEAIVMQIEEILKGHIPTPIEHRIYHKNGEVKWILNTTVLHQSPEGILLGYDGLISDITQRKILEYQVLSSVIETEERERLYFSQELHDGLGPLLSAAKMYLQWLSIPNPKVNKLEIIKDAENLISESTKVVREISFKMSPHVLKNYGLMEAVNSYVNKMKESSLIQFDLFFENLNRFNENAETIAYRVICECINNTLKHANATEVYIKLYCLKGSFYGEYCDNGKGFDVDQVFLQHKGIGLLNIQSRLNSINGQMSIISTAQGGTIINFQIKL